MSMLAALMETVTIISSICHGQRITEEKEAQFVVFQPNAMGHFATTNALELFAMVRPIVIQVVLLALMIKMVQRLEEMSKQAEMTTIIIEIPGDPSKIDKNLTTTINLICFIL
jgi:hypothetical protein